MRGKGQSQHNPGLRPKQAIKHTAKIQAARDFAQNAHKGQMYGHNEYTAHLDLVANIARIAGGDENSIIAAYLHDTVEDTDITVEMIKERFGQIIADLVWRVTNEEGQNRKERAAKRYPKIRENDGAVFLKLCDRYANTTACMIDKPSLFKMYKKEYPAFRDALYSPGVHENLWQALDRLYTL